MRKEKGKVDKKKLGKAKSSIFQMPGQLHKDMFKSNLRTLKNPSTYCAFIYFIALPTSLRSEFIEGATTQMDFAKIMKINDATLSEWKARSGFWDDVRTLQKRYFQDAVGDIILAQKREAIKGSHQSAKLFLESIGYLQTEQKENEVPQMLAEAINNISKILDK